MGSGKTFQLAKMLKEMPLIHLNYEDRYDLGQCSVGAAGKECFPSNLARTTCPHPLLPPPL